MGLGGLGGARGRPQLCVSHSPALGSGGHGCAPLFLACPDTHPPRTPTRPCRYGQEGSGLLLGEGGVFPSLAAGLHEPAAQQGEGMPGMLHAAAAGLGQWWKDGRLCRSLQQPLANAVL